MAPSPWGSAPNCCDRAADDSESADPEQQEFSPQPLGTGRYRLSPHCLNIPGRLRFVSSPERRFAGAHNSVPGSTRECARIGVPRALAANDNAVRLIVATAAGHVMYE